MNRILRYCVFLLLFLLTISIAPSHATPTSTTSNKEKVDDDWDSEGWDDEGDESDCEPPCISYALLRINDVDFIPATEDNPCRVTAQLERAGDSITQEESNLKWAKIVYVLNGDLKARNEVLMTCEDVKCTGEIPAQPVGTQVTFIVSATNEGGSFVTEGFRASSKNEVPDAFVTGPKDKYDEYGLVPDLDILNTSATYDDDRLYFQIQVQGTINEGTLEPPFAHIFGIKLSDIKEKDDTFLKGLLWLYFPLNKVFFQNSNKPFAEQHLKILKETGLMVWDMSKILEKDFEYGLIYESEPEIETHGDTLIGSVRRDAIGDLGKDTVVILSLTAANRSDKEFMSVTQDASQKLVFYYRSHSYTVKNK